MESRRHELKILGDWTINYVWNYQQELLLSKKYDAYQLMVILIDKFYEFAEVEKPEWLNKWIDENALEELDIDELSIVRSILRTHVHEVLRLIITHTCTLEVHRSAALTKHMVRF